LDYGYEKGMKEAKSEDHSSTSPYTTTEYGAFMTFTVIIFLAFIFTVISLLRRIVVNLS